MNNTTSQVPHVCGTCKKPIRAGELHLIDPVTRARYHKLAVCAPNPAATPQAPDSAKRVKGDEHVAAS